MRSLYYVTLADPSSAAMDVSRTMTAQCGPRLELLAVPGVPLIRPGDALAESILTALHSAKMDLLDGDVVVLCSKIVSRSEGRFVDLATVAPSPRALEVAREVERDARLVELILREGPEISRQAKGVLVVRHRLGCITANSGIDLSNAMPEGAAKGSGPWVLLLPEDPDRSAEQVRRALHAATKAAIGVLITDSFSRPFRLGTVGAALGISGLPPLWDRRGEPDLFGRRLEQTITALADQVAAAADLVAGQANESRPVIRVRGLSFEIGDYSTNLLYRKSSEDLYA